MSQPQFQYRLEQGSQLGLAVSKEVITHIQNGATVGWGCSSEAEHRLGMSETLFHTLYSVCVCVCGVFRGGTTGPAFSTWHLLWSPSLIPATTKGFNQSGESSSDDLTKDTQLGIEPTSF